MILASKRRLYVWKENIFSMYFLVKVEFVPFFLVQQTRWFMFHLKAYTLKYEL